MTVPDCPDCPEPTPDHAIDEAAIREQLEFELESSDRTLLSGPKSRDRTFAD